MRIVAGTLRGRRIKTLEGSSTRPTSGMVRGAMFDILGERVIGARVLDLYAGSGAIALEAISRGASHVSSIERAPEALRVIAENLRALSAEDRVDVVRGDVMTVLPKLEGTFQVAIADPPYHTADWEALLALLCAMPGLEWVLLEHARNEATPERPAGGELLKRYAYGETRLALYRTSRSEPV